MKNRVFNGTFGKILRTLGFILILASSALGLSHLIKNNPTVPLFDKIQTYADQLLNLLGDFGQTPYLFIGLTIGFLLLVWTLRKGVVVRVLSTVLLLVLLVHSLNPGQAQFYLPIVADQLPSFLGFLDPTVFDLLNKLLAFSEYILPAMFLVLVTLLWIVFTYKRPKRISVTFLRVGCAILVISVLFNGLQSVLFPNLFTRNGVMFGYVYAYTLSYIFIVLGSVFGIIGFLRK